MLLFFKKFGSLMHLPSGFKICSFANYTYGVADALTHQLLIRHLVFNKCPPNCKILLVCWTRNVNSSLAFSEELNLIKFSSDFSSVFSVNTFPFALKWIFYEAPGNKDQGLSFLSLVNFIVPWCQWMFNSFFELRLGWLPTKAIYSDNTQ